MTSRLTIALLGSLAALLTALWFGWAALIVAATVSGCAAIIALDLTGTWDNDEKQGDTIE
jgi:hypothetical protein